MLWLYLHFPSLQLDSLFSGDKQNEHPLIIVDEKTHKVIQANSLALDSGITLGMGIGSAAALNHELQVLPHRAEIEENRLKEIAHWAYLVTSDMALLPPNGLLIKTSNMLSLYDGARQLLEHIKTASFYIKCPIPLRHWLLTIIGYFAREKIA